MQRTGFTLIELMVALAIFGLLLVLAGPQLATFLASSQVRNAAEAVLNGVQRAQTMAINANGPACMVLDKTTGTGGWNVYETTDGGLLTVCGFTSMSLVQTYKLVDGAPDAAMAVTPPDATYVSFDGFGRLIQKNPDDTVPSQLRCIDVTNANNGSARALRVMISVTNAGLMSANPKLCDPAAAATEPQACPSACS